MTTESSFSSRSRPGSVADAVLSRIQRASSGSGLDDGEADRVLTDRYPVAVVQLFLLDRLAVDQRAVGAPEVDDPELLAPALDAGVVTAGRRIAQGHVVVRRAADAHCGLAGAMVVARVGAGVDAELSLRPGVVHRPQHGLRLALRRG